MTFKKILLTLLTLILSLTLIACNDEQIDTRDDYQKVLDLVNVYYQNSGDNENNVTGNLILTTNIETTVPYDSIAWTTSLPYVIDANGNVNRQLEDTEVKLAVTVVINGIGREKLFTLIVKGVGDNSWLVTFDSNGGSFVNNQYVENYERANKPNDPTKVNYTFLGWYLNEELYDFNEYVTGNITLKAMWEAIAGTLSYTVSFNTDGGSTINDVVVMDNSLIEGIENPTRGNDFFVGWFKDFELTTAWNMSSDRVSSNLVLYAKWSISDIGFIPGRTLLFNDEFDGNSLDLTKWDYQNGNGAEYGIPGWGNGERQYYQPDNIEVSDGTLKIHVRNEPVKGFSYSSSKIVTLGRHSQTFGRIETRAKAPLGDGFWPAFWMMPVNNTYGNGWPHNGEIDIMELRGRQPRRITSALHFRETWGHHYLHGETNLPVGQSIDEFHVYGVEWTDGRLEFYVDDIVYHTRVAREWNNDYNGSNAPFNHDFFIILNIAVGGSFDGYRLPSAEDFPAKLEVDYVRAYAPL